jgi:hypothetical protein
MLYSVISVCGAVSAQSDSAMQCAAVSLLLYVRRVDVYPLSVLLRRPVLTHALLTHARAGSTGGQTLFSLSSNSILTITGSSGAYVSSC